MRVIALFVALFFVVGCASVPELVSSQQEAEPPVLVEHEMLTFEGNGDTFLSYVETTVADSGEHDGHRLVEAILADGVVWQGEAIVLGDRQTVFLQQAQAGAGTAVQVEMPADANLNSVIADLDLPVAQPLYSAHPQIQFVRAQLETDGAWRFDVTLTYPDTGWADYTDGWLITTPADDVLGRRVLLHPHVNEQPFTRSLAGVTIPDDVTEVVVRSHNLISGYAPEVVRLPLAEAGTGTTYEVIR